LNKQIRDYNIRASNDLHITQINNNYGQKTTSKKPCILWNQIPAELNEPSSVESFKQRLVIYLQSAQNVTK